MDERKGIKGYTQWNALQILRIERETELEYSFWPIHIASWMSAKFVVYVPKTENVCKSCA